MRVPKETCPDDVLEPLNERTVPDGPGLCAVQKGSHMPDYNGLLIIFLHLSELVLQPSELVGWVVSCLQDSEISYTASKCVKSDNPSGACEPPKIFDGKLSGVISKLLVLFCRIFTDPVNPVVGEGCHCFVLIGVRIVLIISWEIIQCTLDRVDSDPGLSEGALDNLSHLCGSLNDIFLIGVQLVVRGIVTGPEYHVWLHGQLHEIQK